MVVKVVYYGPGLCGKTTNLEFIYSKTSANSRGEMVSLETETDRTLFFDLLPIDVGIIGGFKTKFQLYTVPGQVFYNSTRKLVLKGVDGIIFVADSQEPMLDANLESFENLKINLAEIGLGVDDIPIVFQYNKRDLNNIISLDILNKALNPKGYPFVEASALSGQGVFETLKMVSKHTLLSVKKTMSGKRVEKKPAPVVKPPIPKIPKPVTLIEEKKKKDKEISKDFFAEEDLVISDDVVVREESSEEQNKASQTIEKQEVNIPEVAKPEPVKIEKPNTVKSENLDTPPITHQKHKKLKTHGLSVDDLLSDLMPTKQTFTKQLKYEITKKNFKSISSATVTVDFKDENGNVIETKTFDSGINKKKGIKKVLLKYHIDLTQ